MKPMLVLACRRAQSGRSMIEMLGLLALAGVMTIGAIRMYQVVRARQARIGAETEMRDLAQNARLLFRGRGDYSGISVDYLIKAGALKTNKSPVSGAELSVRPENAGKSFAIVLENLNFGDCAYFATARLDWAAAVRVNGFAEDAGSYCYELERNKVEFISE